ncbi:MAG: ASKHA domain-containing protein, partial [Dehalococcoidia bacterium]|nr:ASKHA domain-containing protein [Dehalococcoidia bacterium]
IAFDIGTTTVVGYLLDLTNGREMAVASGLNPQGAYGSDLISRLSFVQERDDGLSLLQQDIVFLVNRLIDETVEESGIDPRHIYEVTLVGNVVMHHLLLGIDPSAMARAPYTPVVLDALDLPAAELGLHLGRQAQVHVLPNIAGFVGADMVGALLTTLPHLSPGIQLVIDLGTNGEIALGSRDRLLVCSTAAGPAFEGARVRHGMRAAGGAIDRVRIDTDVHCHVIDGGPPAGICGSGLVDAIAGMLDSGIVTPSGRLLAATQLKPDTGPRLRARIRGAGQPGDELRFVLSTPGGSHDHPEVAITQQDIRELQMAKGAVSAGIQVLKKELGIEDEDIEQVILAGAFGTFVSVESARRIGLIPPLPLNRVKAIGNAAGFGAQLALLSTVERGIAGLIARQSEHVRLSGRTDFQSLFIQALQFPSSVPRI